MSKSRTKKVGIVATKLGSNIHSIHKRIRKLTKVVSIFIDYVILKVFYFAKALNLVDVNYFPSLKYFTPRGLGTN